MAEHGTTYESTGGFGQQAIEAEQPSLTERATGMISGKTTEPRYQSQYGTTEMETGSLADSMRSTLSTRGGIGKYEEQKQPTMGEKIKGMMTGRSAEEQHAYEQGGRVSGYQQGGRGSGYEQGSRSTGYESSRERSGYGVGGQPTIIERVEATFSGRTPQEQHEHNIVQRQERDMERSRGPSSSQPGMMASFGSMVSSATQGMFGSTETSTISSHNKTLKQKMMDSMNEIRTSLTGRTGDTSSDAGSTTYGGTQRRTRGTGY